MDSVSLAAENADLKRSLAESDQKIAVLTEKLEQLAFELAKLKRQVVGPKAERPSPEASERQMSLLSSLQPEEPAEPPAPPPPPPPPASRPPPRPSRRRGAPRRDRPGALAGRLP